MRLFIFAGLFFLGACGLDLFGGEIKPPLPGDRISVLLHERSLPPDPELAEAEILLPRPTVNVSWPQAGGYANHAMHHIDVADVLTPAWQISAGEGSDEEDRLNASPIIAAGRVYTMDSQTLVSAFDTDDGAEIWSQDLTPEEEDDGHIGGGIAFEDGRIIATTGFAEVIALDAGSGQVLWRQNVGGPMRAAPTVRGGRAFVVTVTNKLFALDAADGTVLWTHSGIQEGASLLGGASPAVDAGIVVVAYTSGELVALKVETGRVLWMDVLAAVRRSNVVATFSHIRGRPVIDRERVFAVSYGGLLASIDLRSGRRIWDKEIASLDSPWVAGDFLYVLSTQGELICLSRKGGRVYWVQGLPRYEDPEEKENLIIWTGPILTKNRLIVAGSHGEALAVSPYTGFILGREDLPDGVSVPPVAASGSVYFLSDDAELTAYR
jgi:outer membrane protein assembly factor BamB